MDGQKKKSNKIILWVLVALGAMACMCVVGAAVFAGGTMGAVSAAVRSSEVYDYAMGQALNDPMVIQALGEPVEAGWLIQGSLTTNGPSGEASLAIPLKGSHGSGTLHLMATRTGGEWRYSLLEVEVKDQPVHIDLLQP